MVIFLAIDFESKFPWDEVWQGLRGGGCMVAVFILGGVSREQKILKGHLPRVTRIRLHEQKIHTFLADAVTHEGNIESGSLSLSLRLSLPPSLPLSPCTVPLGGWGMPWSEFPIVASSRV